MNHDSLDPILVYAMPLHSIGKGNRNHILEELKSRLKGRVESAYIFGSYLTDEFDSQSDLDLILVTNTKLTFFKRIEQFLDIKDLPIPVDLLIYTPEEFEKLVQEGESGIGFWKSVTDTMKRII